MDKKKKDVNLSKMIETQEKIAEAIDKFASAELLRAEADRNNSLANINYSNFMLEYTEIIKGLNEISST